MYEDCIREFDNSLLHSSIVLTIALFKGMLIHKEVLYETIFYRVNSISHGRSFVC